MTEGVLWLALNVWNVLLPLGLHLLKNGWWHCQLRRTSIDEGRISLMRDVSKVFAIIEHALAKESPGFEVTHIIFEDLQAIVTTDNLGRVVTSKKSVWWLTHVVLSNTETHHGSVDLAIFSQRP